MLTKTPKSTLSVADDPRWARIAEALAAIAEREGDGDKAVSYWSKAVELGSRQLPVIQGLVAKLMEKLNSLSFSHKKEFVVWYSEAKKEDTRARRVEKMKAMLNNPLINAAVTFIEPFPVGLIVTLVSAAILRKWTPTPAVGVAQAV